MSCSRRPSLEPFQRRSLHPSLEPSSYLRLAACIRHPTSLLHPSLEPLSSLCLGLELPTSLRSSLKQFGFLRPGL